MTSVEDMRTWWKRETREHPEVLLHALVERFLISGLVDADFNLLAAQEFTSATFRSFFQRAMREGQRVWANVPGEVQTYKQISFFNEDDYRQALSQYDEALDRLLARRNALAARAREAGVHVEQLRIVLFPSA